MTEEILVSTGRPMRPEWRTSLEEWIELHEQQNHGATTAELEGDLP